ncbi:MAG: DUF6011 domain-containing protein [Candidatus Heimdallarchaeota archaeon]
MIDMAFLKAGRAIFTFANPDNKRYTFQITKSSSGKMFFISMLTGPDNTSSYTYLGILKNNLELTKASRFKYNSQVVKVFNYAIEIIKGERQLLPGYFLEHNGHCGKCGRTLTTPESINAGIGPVCRRKI